MYEDEARPIQDEPKAMSLMNFDLKYLSKNKQ